MGELAKEKPFLHILNNVFKKTQVNQLKFFEHFEKLEGFLSNPERF